MKIDFVFCKSSKMKVENCDEYSFISMQLFGDTLNIIYTLAELQKHVINKTDML